MKRILLLSSCRAEPGSGAGERSLSMLRALERMAEVDVLVVPPPGVPFEPKSGERVARITAPRDAPDVWYWRRRTYLFSDFRADAAVADEVRRLHGARSYAAFVGRYQLPVFGGCPGLGPSFIDLDDLPIDASRARVPGMQTIRRAALNRSIAPFSGVFVAKRADMRKVRHPRIAVLPCISTRPPASGELRDESQAPRLLFVGGLYWDPNREGVLRFIERSLPRIRERVPSAILRVVGADGGAVAGRPGVDGAGFVTDLAAEYRDAAVVVCPIRRGAGAVVKLAEAVGFGKAVVATPYAAHGYEGLLLPGRDLVTAESDEDFADRCAELLEDGARRRAVASAARAAACQHLSQSAIDAIVERTIGPAL